MSGQVPLSHPLPNKDSYAAPAPRPSKELRYRRRACDRCVSRKIGCDGVEPCSKCWQVGRADSCKYSAIARQPPRRTTQRRVRVTDQSFIAMGPSNLRHTAVPYPRGSAIFVGLTEPTISTTRAVSSAMVTATKSPVTGVTAVSTMAPASVSKLVLAPIPSTTYTFASLASTDSTPVPVATQPPSVVSTVACLIPQSAAPQGRPKWNPMAISSLLSASGNFFSPSPDRPGRRTSAGLVADEFYRDPIEALYAHYADPKANSIPLIVTSTFLTEVGRCISIAPCLKSHEDALYSPVLVRSLLALYVMHQIRLYCRPFLRRLYRKLDRGEIPPVTLDFILCYGMSALSENHLTPAKRRFLSSAYLERLNHVALTQLSTNPSIDTPFLMYQICRLHVLYRTGEAYRSFISLSNKLVMERKYHLIDLLDDGPSDPSEALYHEISLEFKRRVFHDVTSLEHLAGALSGIPSNMALTYAVVQPINDATLLKLLALPPAEDTFPVLVPCMTHIVSGYPSLIELSKIGHDMASLRAQFPLDSLSQFDLAPYLAINRRLSILHPLLLKEFPLSLWATKDKDYNSPVYTAGVCMVHSTYLMVRIFTNVRNWSFGARAVRPEAYPELRAQASKAVDFYTTNCVPLIQQLPPPSHNIIVSVACLLSAFWCITRLHYQADMPDLVHRDLLTIRLYIDIVETFEPYVAYLSSMKKILEMAFREVLAACPGLIPAQLIRRSNLTIETVENT